MNLTLIFSLAVVVLGVFSFAENPYLLLLGLGVAGYTWLTNPKQYRIYTNALVIVYGRPRVRAIPFTDVSHVEMLSLPIGERLRVRLVTGRPLMLMVRDSETFQSHLDEALEKFHESNPREETHEEDSLDQGGP
jgi:hypothetical protein